MITREQVADLRAGDVVELTSENWPSGSVIRGALVEERTGVRTYGTGFEDTGKILTVCGTILRWGDGAPASTARTLTVASRAPRPLYVNHDRAESVVGDVVRDADDDATRVTWRYAWTERGPLGWQALPIVAAEFPDRLRLLVDGTTGQVVP